MERHSWDVSVTEAIAIQNKLRLAVILDDDFADMRLVAGVDVGFEEGGDITRAAIAVLRFPKLELVESVVHRRPTTFPYIPGLLSFREIPAILEALQGLRSVPDIFLCDGAGYAHPRRLGIASHLGVVADIATVGVAKSRLVGRNEPVVQERGAWQPLIHRREVVGATLCTRPGTNPLYISAGHRVSLPSAVATVMNCTTKYRLPETTRWAHKLASGT